jgi:hypothetical protein
MTRSGFKARVWGPPSGGRRSAEAGRYSFETGSPHSADANGVALLIVIMAMLLIGALGSALILATVSETTIASNFQRSSEALYAADAAAERALAELLSAPGWNAVLTGSSRATFADGTPGGTRTMSDGSTIDLGEVLNLANCNKPAGCSDSDMDAVTAERPWGHDNPRWQLYAYGPLDRLVAAGDENGAFYVVVLVGDDPAENDGNPMVDGGAPVTGEPVNSGIGVLAVRAEAFGPDGAYRRVEVTLRRSIRVLSWHAVP